MVRVAGINNVACLAFGRSREAMWRGGHVSWEIEVTWTIALRRCLICCSPQNLWRRTWRLTCPLP